MTRKIVVLTEGLTDPIRAKTGVSVIRYKPAEIAAVFDSTQAGKTAQQLLGVGGEVRVIGSLDDATDANTLLIGVAPAGGMLPTGMRRIVLDAIGRGWTVESGLHEFLCDDAEFSAAAACSGSVLKDVRKNHERDVATRQGIDERCLRIHTVGNDCSLGKMVVSIEVTHGLKRRGHDAKFVATGQTGIMIEGDGCPIDCVVADFINGAAEKLVKANQHHNIIFIEGQGSLVHPRYSSVTLGLLHGTTPDGLILCYEAGRPHTHGMPHVPLPPLDLVRRLNELAANVMHPCRTIGIGINSRLLNDSQYAQERKRISEQFELPACDVYRDGPDVLVDAVLKLKAELDK